MLMTLSQAKAVRTMQLCGKYERLRTFGSVAAPGFMKAEGIVMYHVAGNLGFKKTLEKDEMSKQEAERKAAMGIAV